MNNIMMTIHEMRVTLGDTQAEFAKRYNIPFRTIQNWETGVRVPPDYVLELLDERVRTDAVNRRTRILPVYDPNKTDLPNRRDFINSVSWLQAIQKTVKDPIVFALDEALMCLDMFAGRVEEFIVFCYGPDSLRRYNGITLLGNTVRESCIHENYGLRCTDFNRTLNDALANEDILDMQGITEALSEYYYSNGESFKKICTLPQYQVAFDKLANNAVDYYTS